MIRTVGGAFALGMLAALLPAPAHAASDPETVCTIDDDRLKELSGLVTTADGYVTINDGSKKAKRRGIFYIGADCQVSRTVDFPSDPVDTEDLAVAPDGTLWVGDIGDNDTERDTIGLWRLSPGATEPELLEARYPDGPHNAETLVLDGQANPVIITKDPAGAEIFRFADGALQAAGTITIPETTTGNPRDEEGRRVLTGGTNSPDGTKIAIRTYADAFVYDVTDGDVITALTTGTPTIVPLPDEPQGEAIAFSRDGASLLTVSEDAKPDVLRYSATGDSTSGSGRLWRWLAAAAGLLAVGSLAAAATLRSRRR
ncbi:hypothetical protein [Actinoplanes sp. NPDC051851]|uniref:hypothetical protein n=1 Tax=Actinoplanes sp. NPDC051851 TaxID=3154753 RepID=UPI0034284BA9